MIKLVIGGQWGSEAKGAIAAYMCLNENVQYAVRTGAVNAGHTVHYRGGIYKMQQLPTGWVNPKTNLIIGAGALIHPETLEREIRIVNEVMQAEGHGDVRNRLFIDYRAGLHLEHHTDRSTKSGRHHAIGATGKGCSEALIDRIRNRGSVSTDPKLFVDTLPEGSIARYRVLDTADMLNCAVDRRENVLLEATQGTLLDLYFGPYPYTTHKPTGPGVWLAEAGLSPNLPLEITMVVRTYPIRVAGNSGPMKPEISWPMLAREINAKLVAANEPPFVAEKSLQAFEELLQVAAANTDDSIPLGSDGTDQHTWSADDRRTHQVALSELNKAALSALSDRDLAEVSKLFEFTTVTKKLRRIARLNYEDLKLASQLVRPHRVALTFMNYEFPQFAGDETAEEEYIRRVESACGAPVALTSWGPKTGDIIRRGPAQLLRR